jgi:LmbE family N-acetylglucosaminyl deacetylase
MTADTDTPDSTKEAHTWRPARFMLIAGHPDDADFGPAATAARWIDEGSVGWLVCCTSGDQGGEDPDIDPLELAALREKEQRDAAAVIGYAGVSFLHQPDGALANDLALRELLVREIRTFRPDAVLATDPETIFHGDGGVNHTDHRAAGMAAVDASYPAARNPMAFPWLAREGLAAHRVRRLYLFWSNSPSVRVDVTATIGRKIDALRAHASQIKEPDRLESRIRDWAREEGEPIGSQAAEALRVIVIDDDDDEAPEPAEAEAADASAEAASEAAR